MKFSRAASRPSAERATLHSLVREGKVPFNVREGKAHPCPWGKAKKRGENFRPPLKDYIKSVLDYLITILATLTASAVLTVAM